jgi:uncharacterized protein YdaL
VLVLYDDSGAYGQFGEVYATAVGTLASHFGPWSAMPVARYRASELFGYRAAIYIGSTYDQPLPQAFLDDVSSGKRPVMWLHNNIWQLAHRTAGFRRNYGYLPGAFDTESFAGVLYKGVELTRSPENMEGILRYEELDSSKVEVLGWTKAANGRELPWAIRSRQLTYIGENPLAFIGPTDRYLAFADLLFDLLAPHTPERHRALVRIEDVHPLSSARKLRAIADYLSKQRIPFSVAVIPLYVDPLGVHNHGRPLRRSLRESPEVVRALKYMTSRGGTLVLHGYTHQFGRTRNPYSGVTGEDFEFYKTRVDDANNVVYDGPLPGDSPAWARERVDKALAIFESVGLPRPTIFEYPHYAGSVDDSRAIATRFKTVYQRATYVGGVLSGQTPNYEHRIELFFPFVVKDVYGFKVLPENLGNYVTAEFNNNPARGVDDICNHAQIGRVVRDGFASFFFHPLYDVDILRQIVTGIRAAGFTFVSAADL